MKSLGLSLLVGIVLVAAVAPASAQTRRERREAREAYGRGQAQITEGQFVEAEASFRAALELIPNPVVLVGIAGALEGQGKVIEAVAILEQYLEARADAPDRAEIEARLTALRATPGHLSVTSQPPGAHVELDGQDTGEVTPAEFDLPPGQHVVILRADGYEEAQQGVDLGFAAREEVAAELVAEPEPEPIVVDDEPVELDEPEEGDEEEAADEGPGTAVWVTSGLAAAGLVAGTILGFRALSEESSFDEMPSEGSADRGERYAIFADVAFGIAAVSAITAVVLLLTKGSDDDEEEEDAEAASASISPLVGPSAGGVAAQVGF